MFVLSRKIGEVIVINENIRIKIIRVVGNLVKVGIEAPIEIPVYREELKEDKDWKWLPRVVSTVNPANWDKYQEERRKLLTKAI